MVEHYISSMIGNLFYLCPSCLAEDSLYQKRDFIFCQHCLDKFPFYNNHVSYNNTDYSISQFYGIIRASLSLNKNKSKEIIRISKKARLRQGVKKIVYRGRDNFLSTIESPVEVDTGELVFTKDVLIFQGKLKRWIFPKFQITGYTTNSKYFEFKIRERPFYQVYFEEESPLKYEELFTDWINIYSSDVPMIEHQPKIIYHIPKSPAIILANKDISNWNLRENFSFFEFILHICIGRPIVQFLKWYSKLSFKNEYMIPQTGPFILLMNHESYLDPIIISTLLKRRIAFFTKSTSFADRILQPIFRAYRSLPNRRYEIDPQVVRQAVQVLKKGNCIGIFPEGERTWNGKLLPFKYNTVKFLMSVQIPIVIVTIKGTFNVLPRWTHRLYPGEIEIEVQRYFSLLPGKWGIEDLKNELELYFKEI
jgi:1-acyl-sn-glycerol-3-phosphate acyltransferase